MSKILDIASISDEDLSMFQNWKKVDNKLNEFTNKAREDTFKFLFGKDEGERLWKHYIVDCRRDFRKFETYLSTEQRNKVLINAVLNDKIYIQ